MIGLGLYNRSTRVVGASSPGITGLPFPGKVLAYGHAAQWYRDGVAISGAVGANYTVDVGDIGREITCGGSAPVRIWHPRDIEMVEALFVPQGFSTDTAMTPPTHGQTVTRWYSLQGNNTIDSTFYLEQTISDFRPVYRAAGGNGRPAIQFDGSNDWMEGSRTPAGWTGYFGFIIATTPDVVVAGAPGQMYAILYLNLDKDGDHFGVGFLETTVPSERRFVNEIHMMYEFDFVEAGIVTVPRSPVSTHIVNMDPDIYETYAGIDGDMNTKAIPEVDYNLSTSSFMLGRFPVSHFNYKGCISCLIAFKAANETFETLDPRDLNRLRQYAGLVVGRDLGLAVE